MIRYDLRCDGGHGFDGWFRSSADFDRHQGGGLLSCPHCGSAEIAKALMAPAVSTREETSREVVLLGDEEQKLRAMLKSVREEVTRNAENVGPRFAEVARKMHEGEMERASVYGRASSDEVRALAEDGVDFCPLPSLPDEGN